MCVEGACLAAPRRGNLLPDERELGITVKDATLGGASALGDSTGTMFNFSFRSIVFAFGLSIAVAVASLQGVSMLEVAKTALVACIVFLGFMIGEAAMGRVQKKAVAKHRKKGKRE